METINSYLDTMFAALPQSAEVLRIKAGLLETMEDKYNDLKAAGKSENEAVGQVISEFGNIDELKTELGLEAAAPQPEQEDTALALSEDEVREYIALHRKGGACIGIGVMLCVLAPAALIAVRAVMEHILTGWTFSEPFVDTLSVGSLLLLIAIAVALFIVWGIRLERYEHYEKSEIRLPEAVHARLTEENNAYTTPFALSIAGGVAIILLSVIEVIAVGTNDFTEKIAVAIMLAMIAFAVFLFVSAGMRRESYEVLLGIGDHSKKTKDKKKTKAGRITDTISSILWPLVVAAFLCWGFWGNGWGIAWILFPIAGLLTGVIEGVVRLATKEYKD